MPVSDMDAIIPLWDAIQVHSKEYDSGDTDYSVTTLLDCPRIVHLNKRHGHKIDVFVQDQLASFIGTGLHNYLEYCLKKVEHTTYITEERLFKNVEDRKISGAYDVVRMSNDEDMYDLKTTSVWKAMFGNKDDWAAQQNMYRLMYKQKYGKDLRSIRIIGMFLDWSLGGKMRGGKKYPNTKCLEYSLPRWGYKKTEDFMLQRVINLKDYEDTPDDDLPECTYEDMWSSPDVHAVMAKNRKNALRLCDSRKAATKWVSNYMKNPNCKHRFADIYIDCRPAERKRCEHWCGVNTHCNQFHNYLQAIASAEGGGA